jgi:transcription-repair coupling factor (superfamily II helicase)
VHYKRIASARDEAALNDLKAEIADRFGPLPEATRNLFRITQLKLRAGPAGLRRLDAGPGGGFVEFGPRTGVDPALLVELLRTESRTFRLDKQQRLRFTAPLEEAENRFCFVEQLVGRLVRSTAPAAGRATAAPPSGRAARS